MRRLRVTTIVMLLMLTLSTFGVGTPVAADYTAVVANISGPVNVRSLPSTTGAVLAQIPAGGEATVIQTGLPGEGDVTWINVAYMGQIGYVRGDVVSAPVQRITGATASSPSTTNAPATGVARSSQGSPVVVSKLQLQFTLPPTFGLQDYSTSKGCVVYAGDVGQRVSICRLAGTTHAEDIAVYRELEQRLLDTFARNTVVIGRSVDTWRVNGIRGWVGGFIYNNLQDTATSAFLLTGDMQGDLVTAYYEYDSGTTVDDKEVATIFGSLKATR